MDEKQIVQQFERAQDRLVLQASDLSLETLAIMVESHAVDIDPAFQRRERWSTGAQSALIESFLLNIPVPPIYLAEDDFGTYSVIDGKQRLTTIKRFMRNELTLNALDTFRTLEGLTFEKLPRPLRNALAVRPYVRAVTLLKQSDPELKYEVFTRLNTGGHPLLPQEIRNAIFRGPLNDLLISLSATPFLQSQLKIKTKRESAYTSMLDVELVLRFLTLSEEWDGFSGDFRRSMDRYMARHQHDTPEKLQNVGSEFLESIGRCKQFWGKDAFKRPVGHQTRDQFLVGMYDSQMVAASMLSNARAKAIAANPQIARNAITKLFKDSTFEEAVRIGTNTPSRVKYRIEMLLQELR